MKRLIAVLFVCAAGGAFASGGKGLPADLVTGQWEQMTFDGKQPNDYASCGQDCVAVSSDKSVSLIGRPAATDLRQSPVLTWEWKIARPVPVSDLTRKGGDDRPLAIYVTFPYEPETATITESLMRPLVEMARGADAPARTISYVWGGYGSPGDVVNSPYFGDVNVMVIARNQSAPIGEWLRETVDVAADHERIFGVRPARAAHVLIGADTDDIGRPNEGFVRGLMFQAK